MEENIKEVDKEIFHKSILGIRPPEENVQQNNENNTKTLTAAKKSDIRKYQEDLETTVLSQIPQNMKLDGKVWICDCCKRYLTKGNMPPQCHQNGLVVKEGLQDNPDTSLTEVENVLISRLIPFAKLYPLRSSRWSALDGKIINIPITKEKLEETISSFPRTPNEGALIGVAVKRKKQYETTYKKPFLARPHLLVKWLKELKRQGNPEYQDINIDSVESYEQRCREEDPEGAEELFPEMDDAMEVDNEQSEETKEDMEDAEQEGQAQEEEEEYRQKDPVKKNQTVEERSFFMANMFPEEKREEEGDDELVVVAPGEGGKPVNIMSDRKWDLKSYPCLNNLDGSNGLNQKRDVYLTDQKFFEQRLLNVNEKFAKHPEVIFTFASAIEQKQIDRNQFTSHTRGEKVASNDGKVTFQRTDAFAVLEKIKNTPKYWQEKKNELLAKMETFGPFHWFFTLSCADRRWPQTYMSYLRSKGLEVEVEVKSQETGNAEVKCYVLRNGEKVDLDQYKEEHLEETDHEIIKRSVLTVTRIFDHRVKEFIKHKITGGGNPMSILYWQYRIEFQMRGAAHAHGVLWTDITKLDKMFPGVRSAFAAMGVNRKLLNLVKTGEKVQCEEDQTSQSETETTGEKYTKTEQMMREVRALTDMVDSFVTCSLNEGTVGKEAAQIAAETQCHGHSKSCRKYIGITCRFKYPKYPSPVTIITQKYTIKEHMEKAEKLLEKIKIHLESKEVMKEIKEKIPLDMTCERELYVEQREKRVKMLCDISEVNYDDYLEALTINRQGYGVILQRDISEIWTNNYNKNWLVSWNGNLDIQPCFDKYAVATYITEYAYKEEEITSVLRKVLEDNKDEDMKTKMRKVAYAFQKTRQMGEAEAAYKIIPSLVLCNSNVTCKWVATGREKETYKRTKRATQADKEAGMEVMAIDGMDGEWCNQWDLRDKYRRRDPRLHNIVMAQYGRMKEAGAKEKEPKKDTEKESKKSRATKEVKDFNHPELFEVVCCSGDCCKEVEGAKYRKKIEIPTVSHLVNVNPGEPGTMKRRTAPAALRSYQPKQDVNPIRYFLHELMLYVPWGAEGQPNLLDITDEEIHLLYVQWENHITEVKKNIMPHLEDIQEARYWLKEAEKLDTEQVGDVLAAEREQENLDVLLEDYEQWELEEMAAMIHPDMTEPEDEDQSSKPERTMIVRTELVDKEELCNMTRNMDKDQRTVVDMAIKFFKDIARARTNGDKFPSPQHVMVHGAAGVGKSHVIKVVDQWGQHILRRPGDELDQPYILKTSFMGTAAANIEGQTLTSTFGFQFNNKHMSMKDQERKVKTNQFKNLVMVIIDEISMVKSDMLYQLYYKLQEIKNKHNIDFGGVAVFAFGDLFQLKPVMGRQVFDRPTSESFLDHHLTDPLWEKFEIVNLETNHRQGKDRDFADMLNRLRVVEQDQVTIEDQITLHERVRKRGHPDLLNADLNVVCTRAKAHQMNVTYLNELPGEEHLIEAVNFKSTQKKYEPMINTKDDTIANTGFMQSLKIKCGAKVMLIKNLNTADALTNGQTGKIVAIAEDKQGKVEYLMVKFDKRTVGREAQARHPNLSLRYPGSTKIEKFLLKYCTNKSGTGSMANLIQFPLRLSHATTAHKTQGQTVEKPKTASLDLASVFQAHQAYVMIGRLQFLDQIFISGKFDIKKIYADQKVLREYEKMNKRSLNNNPLPWLKKSKSQIKIATLNICSLLNKLVDLKSDHNIVNADMIHLAETWLEEGGEERYKMEGYKGKFLSAGRGRGLASYHKDMFKYETSSQGEGYQIQKFVNLEGDLHTISLYRSSTFSIKSFTQKLLEVITWDVTTVVSGDVNICARDNPNNILTAKLTAGGFRQLSNEPTHNQGHVLDHLYILDTKSFLSSEAIRTPVYFSDHDILGIILTRVESDSDLNL